MKKTKTLNRREFITGMLGAGAAMALLGGCKHEDASGKMELTYNTFWTGRDAHSTAMDWMYAEFRKRHPEIDFKVLQVAGGAMDNGQKSMAELAAGYGPDILHDTTYDQVNAGYCLDLTDHIAPWIDRFYPDALASCTWDGRVFSLPTEYSYVPCIWNTAVLDSVGKKIPSTFDEYMDVGDALKKKNINLTSLSLAGHHIFFSIVFGYPNANEVIAKKEWKAEPFREAMKVCKQLIDAGFLPSNDAELLFSGGASLFQNHKLGHYMNGAWTIINEIVGEGVNPELRKHVAFSPFPTYNGVRPIRAWVATKTALNYKLNKDKAKLKAALSFLELFTSEESVKRFVYMAHSPQGVKVEITEEMAGPLLYKFISSRDEATSIYVFPNNPSYFSEQVAGRAMPDSFTCLLEGGSLDAAMSVFHEGLSL